jgi:hypothetical protein
MKLRWLLGFFVTASLFFVGCSSVSTPALSKELQGEELQEQAFILNWIDRSSNRGPVQFGNGSAPGSFSVDLTSARWISAGNGLGPVKRDPSKGLIVHADSSINFDVASKCGNGSMFLSTRLDQIYNPSRPASLSAIGRIYVDNVLITSIRAQPSKGFYLDARAIVQVGNLQNVKRLKFTVSDLDDGNTGEEFFWASPTITCSPR